MALSGGNNRATVLFLNASPYRAIFRPYRPQVQDHIGATTILTRGARYGTPEIFNTDQGSQFTSADFTQVLTDNAIKISMDGKGRWLDNVFVERLWRSVKYEHVYLHAYESVTEAREQLAGYFQFYNEQRPHSSLDARTPDAAYFDSSAVKLAA